MLFNSFIFIFIFLPVALIGWYCLNRYKHYKLANFFLTAMSLWFYGYFNINYLAIIIVSIAVNYLLSALLNINKSALWNRIGHRVCLFAGIIFNLGLLFYFKYYDFFIENINMAFHTDFALKNILLPLGISFFTFQQLSFIIDRCLGRAEHYSLITYAAFVTFFPQLVAGPIVLHTEMIPQLNDVSNRKFNAQNFAQGIVLFVLGLGKRYCLPTFWRLPLTTVSDRSIIWMRFQLWQLFCLLLLNFILTSAVTPIWLWDLQECLT